MDSYTTRKKEQDEKVSNLNKYSQYKKIVSDIEEKLLEIKKLCSLKKKFEKENQTDEDIAEFIETMKENSNLQTLSTNILQVLAQPNTTDSRIQKESVTKGNKSAAAQ